MGTYLAQRTVNRVGETYVLDIGYTALNPNLAAKMANAIADAYIEDQLETKYQTTRRANVWLQDRIKELRAQAAAADRAVSDYKEKNKIIDLGGGGTRLLGEEQVAQLNAQLISARTATADAKARLDRINEIMNQDVPDAGTTDSLQSGMIGRLRNQYLDLAPANGFFRSATVQTISQSSTCVPRWLSCADRLPMSLTGSRKATKVIMRSARPAFKALETNLAGLISNSQLINRDRIGLSDLETKAKIYHSIYDNFLNRYMEASQQQSFPITDAHVISAAATGLPKWSKHP